MFDFNIHLVPEHVPLEEKLEVDRSLAGKALVKAVENRLEKLKDCTTGCNLMLFNTSLQTEDTYRTIQQAIEVYGKPTLLTWLLDFRAEHIESILNRAWEYGIRSFMFHAYLQNICYQDYPQIIRACQWISEKRGLICIDTSYGSLRMYDYDNLKLVAHVSQHIQKSPIVMIHGGGKRILEAMLLAEHAQNLILDTSFSLDYYLGSSLEKDFVFALKKLGSKRFIYGSDHPYIDFKISRKNIHQFLSSHAISEEEQNQLTHQNAHNLLTLIGA